ncbi:MAG: hypothetical protein WBF33_38170 [Candidatus Nitrosopolaris sp.]
MELYFIPLLEMTIYLLQDLGLYLVVGSGVAVLVIPEAIGEVFPSDPYKQYFTLLASTA